MSIYGGNWGLIGHEWAVDLLARRLEAGRVGHAYLITGSPSLGKSTLAMRLAQALNCTGPVAPCGECRACRLIERSQHPDFHDIQADGRTIKIEQMRNLQSDLTLRPMEARYRVALIRDFENATGPAADALLKTLEEPPSDVRLLITADRADGLLATIVSRCQVISLRPVAVSQIESALVNRGVDAETALDIAHLSGGKPGWALNAVSDESVLETYSTIVDGLMGILFSNRAGRFETVENLYRLDNVADILDIWQSWWRDVVLLAERSEVTPVNVGRYEELARLASQIAPEEARAALMAVRETMEALDKNANTRLALDVMMLSMPYLTA